MFEKVLYPRLRPEVHSALMDGSDFDILSLNVYEEFIVKKLKAIYSNEVLMKTEFDQKVRMLEHAENIDISELAMNIKNYIDLNFSYIYELPDLDFFQDKYNDYLKFYNLFAAEFMKYNHSYIRQWATYREDIFNIWETILVYLKFNILRDNSHLNYKYFFNFNLNKIDLFLKIIKKSHLTSYFSQLRRHMTLMPTQMNFFELKIKVDLLEDFYVKFKEDFSLTQENEFINNTFDLLIQHYLISDKGTFLKAIENEKVTLVFKKTKNGSPLLYIVGFVFEYMSSLKDTKNVQLFKFDNVNFSIDGSSKTYSELKTAKKKSVPHKMNNSELVVYIKDKLPQIEDWYKSSYKIFDFRPPLFIGNPF